MKRKSILSAYIELTKPRILTLVLVTTLIGFYLGGEGHGSLSLLIFLVLGVAFVTGGSSALNHYLEREFDSKMIRTKKRPIPMEVGEQCKIRISPPARNLILECKAELVHCSDHSLEFRFLN